MRELEQAQFVGELRFRPASYIMSLQSSSSSDL